MPAGFPPARALRSPPARQALSRVVVWPRALRAVGRVDASVELLGKRYAYPVGVAPVAMQVRCTAGRTEGARDAFSSLVSLARARLARSVL